MQRNEGQNLDTETRSTDFLDAVTKTTISQVPTDVSVGPTWGKQMQPVSPTDQAVAVVLIESKILEQSKISIDVDPS